jgi:hypothetical protein
MKKIFLPIQQILPLFIYSFVQVLVPSAAVAQSKGIVRCNVEWQANQTYVYVFTGVVSSKGVPCANAKIQIQVSAANQPDQILETVASAEGRYELKVAFQGMPEQFADWKLVAQIPQQAAPAEIEGRSILTQDTDTVEVQRPIQIEG